MRKSALDNHSRLLGDSSKRPATHLRNRVVRPKLRLALLSKILTCYADDTMIYTAFIAGNLKLG